MASELSGRPMRQASLLEIQNRRRGKTDNRNRQSLKGIAEQPILPHKPSQVLEIESKAGFYRYHHFPRALIWLNFRDADLERDFKRDYNDKSYAVFRVWAVLFVVFQTLTFFTQDWNHSDETLRTTLFYARLPSLVVALACLAATHPSIWKRLSKQAFIACSLLIQMTFFVIIVFTTLNENPEDEVALPNSAIAAVLVGYTSYRLRMPWATVVGWTTQLGCNIIFLYAIADGWKGLTYNALLFNVPMLVFNIIGMMTCYQIEKTERENFKKGRIFVKECACSDYERQRGEYLLFNILPKRIVQRLTVQPTISERYPSTTVMFICIENMIDVTSTLTTSQSVKFMNDIFEVCDKRAEEFGVEKVKTINDKYMCVSGAPDARDNHAASMADMALAVFEDFETMQNSGELPFTARAGVSSGPIVAGVIGLQKFCWDIWGDTVNTASRMEYPKNDKPCSGKIRVSQMTQKLIESTHECTPNGELSVKGKGMLMTYLLEGRKAGAAASKLRGLFRVEDPLRDASVFDMDEMDEIENVIQNQLRRAESIQFDDRTHISDYDVDEARILDDAEEPANGHALEVKEDTAADENKESGAGDESVHLQSVVLSSSSQSTLKPKHVRKVSEIASRIRLKKKQKPAEDDSARGLRRVSAFGNEIHRGPPRLDIEGYIEKTEFELPSWAELPANLRKEFYTERWKNNMEEQPTLRFSLLVAVGLYVFMTIMDPLLISDAGDLPISVFYARGIVVAVWLVHYLVASLPEYKEMFSYVFATLCIVGMVVVGSFIHRSIEDNGILPGGELYAPLPVTFAIYLGYSVFALPYAWMVVTIVLSITYLIVESALGHSITTERTYFWSWMGGLILFGLFVSWTIEYLAFVSWSFGRSASRQKRMLKSKQSDADKLLRNIVPQHIVAELTTTDMSGIARNYKSVSILFSDISGFTALSKNLPPHRLVNWLNSFFTNFDKLAQKHHIEKIKTIGDAYVAVGGLVDEREHHVNDICNMAIELQHDLMKLNEQRKTTNKLPVCLRIGVHVGEVLAGIIGRRKFQYDIFGRSVVIAEEMESSGQVGRVHISDDCKARLENASAFYEFEAGEPFHHPDGREMPTHFITYHKQYIQSKSKIDKLRGDAD